MTTYRKKLLDKDGNTIIPALAGDETGWVVTADLANSSVTTEKIADGAVTPAKIASSTYTVAEQEIGTWYDGKTIYRRILVGTISTTAGTAIYEQILEGGIVNELIDVKGWIGYGSSTGNWLGMLPLQFPEENHSFRVYKQSGSGKINLACDSPSQTETKTYKIVIEYTKV